uniref:LytR/AlgR family response regulator transcription factor n=1 Tax=Eubacterium cellulosolvens TaxID=29322 RepID=UPI0004860829|nr:LytTR family DNA-binding domain-containing protein [[Eubacterium] cellulosolvens]
MEQLNVCICEDNEKDYENLRSLISREGANTVCEHYGSAEDFLNEYYPGKFDLLFLDIYMQSMTGIEALERIRKVDQNLSVVLVTTSTDFALESYRLHAMRYVEKPVRREDVSETIQLCMLKKESQPHLEVKSGYNKLRIPFDQILYVEQQGRNMTICQADEQKITVSGKLDDIQDQFEGETFFRCHKSYIVNLSHIRSVDHELQTFVMTNEDCVHIRRESFYKAKHAYEDFLFDIARRV